jgi:outer membrane protein assembly factor BamB
MGLRKRLKDFRNWCPQPPNPLSTKLKQYSVPIAILLTVTLLAASFSIFYSSIPFAAADWPMFHGGPSHNGGGTGSPVLAPTLLWNYTTGGGVYSSPAIVGGVVYIGSEDGNVYALNAANGLRIWNYSTGGDVESSPAVINGVVYIGSEVPDGSNGYVGDVYALNAANGSKLRNYTTGNYYNYVESSPAVVNGVVYVGSSVGLAPPASPTLAITLGTVYALNATNGDKLWNYTTESSVDSSPAVVGGVVYIGSEDGNVYALNAANGVQLWSYPTSGGVYSSPAVINSVVYVSSGFNVYALNATNGDKLWSYPTGYIVDSSPAVINGVVYVGSGDFNVYALNAANGSKLWNYTTGNGVDSSPAVVGGVVYINSDDGNLYALNATSGHKLWNYSSDFGESSPAVVNGVVYVGSNNGNVYALGSLMPSSSPTSSNTLPIIVGGIAAVVIAAAVVFLMFQKRLKTKTIHQLHHKTPLQFQLVKYPKDNFAISNQARAINIQGQAAR